MSASALRYRPRLDRNLGLRGRIVALVQRHRRYGAEMIYLKLRQAGERFNHKRVERLYRLEQLQIRRRRRKKIPVADRQPLLRPGAANKAANRAAFRWFSTKGLHLTWLYKTQELNWSVCWLTMKTK